MIMIHHDVTYRREVTDHQIIMSHVTYRHDGTCHHHVSYHHDAASLRPVESIKNGLQSDDCHILSLLT